MRLCWPGLGLVLPIGVMLLMNSLPDKQTTLSHLHTDAATGRHTGGVSVPLTPHYTALLAMVFLMAAVAACRSRGDRYFGREAP